MLFRLTGEINRNDLPFAGVYIDEPPADKVDNASKTFTAYPTNTAGQAETAAAPVGKGSDSVISAYYDPQHDWRRIDDDWLNAQAPWPSGSIAISTTPAWRWLLNSRPPAKYCSSPEMQNTAPGKLAPHRRMDDKRKGR